MKKPTFEQQIVGPRRVGGRYLCGYWHVEYEVTAINGCNLTVRWADGRTTTHCTAWDARRDRILS